MAAKSSVIPSDVLAVLSGCRVEGSVVFLPPEQLERKLYTRVNDVLTALGGTWNRKAKGHIFANDPAETFDNAIVTGRFDRPADFGFFPTPPAVVEQLIDLADLHTGMHVLEPSAGHGAIADAVNAAGCNVVCVELQAANCSVLRAKGYEVHQGDFLTRATDDLYDRVVMNPPFSRQQDIDHVRHAHAALKPGGLLVSVMGAGIEFRQDRKTVAFRELVEAVGGSIDALPEGSFKVSGTNVRTVVVTMPYPEERPS